MKRRRVWILLLILLVCLAGATAVYVTIGRQVNLTGMLGGGSETALQAPPGFEVELFASGLRGPRFIAFGPDGVLYVADRGNNRIAMLPDADGDRVRRDVAAARHEEVLVLPFADVDASSAAADQHAGARLACPEPRIAPRFARGDDAEQGCAGIAPRIRAACAVLAFERQCLID